MKGIELGQQFGRQKTVVNRRDHFPLAIQFCDKIGGQSRLLYQMGRFFNTSPDIGKKFVGKSQFIQTGLHEAVNTAICLDDSGPDFFPAHLWTEFYVPQ